MEPEPQHQDMGQHQDKGQRLMLEDMGQRLMLVGTELLLLDMERVAGHVVELDTLQGKKLCE